MRLHFGEAIAFLAARGLSATRLLGRAGRAICIARGSCCPSRLDGAGVGAGLLGAGLMVWACVGGRAGRIVGEWIAEGVCGPFPELVDLP